MARKNKLLEAPPQPVALSLRALGENLRQSRLRRNITIAQAGERIGTGPRAVMEAEKGNPATSIAVYAALLWIFNQLDQWDDVGAMANDTEGLALSSQRGRRRARQGKGRNHHL